MQQITVTGHRVKVGIGGLGSETRAEVWLAVFESYALVSGQFLLILVLGVVVHDAGTGQDDMFILRDGKLIDVPALGRGADGGP